MPDRTPPDSQKRRKPVKAHDVSDHTLAVQRRSRDLGDLIKWSELTG